MHWMAWMIFVSAALAPGDGITASLELIEPRVWQGEDATLRLRLVNTSEEVQAVSAAALYGDGLSIAREGGEWRPRIAPPGSHVEIPLPPRAELAALLHLAELAPGATAEPGILTVRFEAAAGDPLPVEVWTDYARYRAVLETDHGTLELEFFPREAPATVRNFCELVEKQFYDGLTFHRVVPGFMIQGGCPRGDGTGNAGHRIPFEANGLLHERGTVSMARQEDLDSASCQFFICLDRKRFLDGNYTAFGRVVKGMEVADRIAAVECEWTLGGVDDVPSHPKEKVFLREARLVRTDP